MVRWLITAATCVALLGATVPQHKRQVGASSAVSDAALEKAIRERFAKSKLASEKLTVHSQGGVVTIEGRTDVVQHKGTATRMARTAGARLVVNKIQISEAAREKAAANLSKGRRRAQVKRTETVARSAPR
jgi:hypothetical protein